MTLCSEQDEYQMASDTTIVAGAEGPWASSLVRGSDYLCTCLQEE